MPQTRQARKERRTFSLSQNAISYLEAGCAETRAPSMSAYLENVVRDLQAKTQMALMEAATVAYYDNLSTAEIEEQSDWGEVGAASLSKLEA
jgi:hypothetical protein